MSTRESAKAILVNDDPLQLRLAAAVLEKDGLKVLACQSAEEALRVMRDQGAPDVIVTDLHMPGIDGWRLCRLLRSAEYKAFNKTPILVISATFSGADAEEVTSELGANGFLSIPYEPSTLRAYVRSLLDGKTPATSIRALIIEDSATLAQLLRQAFEAHGYTVYVAETGEKALRLLRERSPDVVVIDYHLPDITGDAILPEVKRPGSAAVAVVITTDPSTELAAHLMQMGADGYIRKPFDPDYLIDLCEKARRARALLRVEDLLEDRTRQLRESQERFRSLFEGIPEAVIVHDDKSVILHANEVATRWLSWPTGGLDGRSLRQIVAPEFVSALPGQLRVAIADGSCAFETTMISRTGRRIAVEVNERPIIFEDKRAILSVARDVTERKLAEEALRQSEERFRFLVENAFDGISVCEFDPVTRRRKLIYCNDRFVLMTGYTRETLEAVDDLTKLLTFHHAKEEIDVHYDCVLKGSPFTGTLSWRRPDGQENACEWAATSLKMGDRYYIVSIDRDVSRRQRVEEELEEAVRRFDSVIENMPLLSIQGFDRDGVIRRWNAASTRLYGYSAAEAVGRHRQGLLLAPDVAQKFERILRQMWDAAQPAPPVEWPVRTQDGDERWVYSTMFPIFEQDKVVEVFCMDVDITERKRAEREMQSLLQLHQNTLATMPSALIVLNAGLNIIMANRRYLEAWGFEEAQVIGKNIVDVFPASLISEQQLLQRIEAVRAGGAPDLLLGVPHRVNGHVDKYLNIRICGLPAASGEEEEPGALLVIDDVTQQRRMEEQIRQSAKMESIGILAGGVAHDFNNLLTGIIGYTQLLHRKARQDPNITRDLAQIRELADRAAGLTRQLLAFSRRQTLDPIVLNINSLVNNASKMLKRIIGEDIVLEVLAAPDLGTVRADPGQVEQVLLNLAVNARDAMPKGGKLTIETNNVQLDHKYAQHRVDAKPGPYVVISVSDTGCGMDQQTLDHIFEPFFTTKDPGKGTGLGLSTVYGIVTQHGGHISASSAVGVGTTFRIYLPRVDAELSPEALDEEEAGPSEGGERILLVEDEPTVRRLVQRVLQDSGYTVAAAPCPTDAEKIFAEHAGDFDMLLTDVVMPGQSGKDLYEKLAKADPSLKILYMSGYIDTAMVRHGVLSRDAAFIQKPFTPEALVQKVREVLDGGGAGYRKNRARRTQARRSI